MPAWRAHRIHPKPDNFVDPQAVAVCARGIRIGYLTAGRAPWIGSKIKNGMEVRAICRAATLAGAAIRFDPDGRRSGPPATAGSATAEVAWRRRLLTGRDLARRLTARSIGAHAESMIRLTLPDGTRTQLGASEITDVEPVPGGALVHRAAGDPIKVMQNARTIQTRVNTELDTLAAESETDVARTIVTDQAQMTGLVEATPLFEPAAIPLAEPASRMHRLKRLIRGRVSGMALTIGQTKRG